MAQQFQNGGHHKGSVTISNRSTHRYAVVNEPGKGKHYHKPRKHHIPNKSKRNKLINRFNDSLFYLNSVHAFRYHRAH